MQLYMEYIRLCVEWTNMKLAIFKMNNLENYALLPRMYR